MTNSILSLTINQIILKYNLLHNDMKSLGQNFIRDESLLDKIVRCALPIDSNTDIIEIGPGPTGLTRSILKLYPNRLICIEKDIRFKLIHDELKRYYPNLSFIYNDALKLKLSEISNIITSNIITSNIVTSNIVTSDIVTNKIVVISNLPYNIGTALLTNWLLNDIQKVDKLVLMFQQEVADRICAKTGTKAYGKLSVLSQLLCEVSKLFNVSNKAFIPQPKVTSSVILLKNRNLNFGDLSSLVKLLNICFQSRRKMISSILNKYICNSVNNTCIDNTCVDNTCVSNTNSNINNSVDSTKNINNSNFCNFRKINNVNSIEKILSKCQITPSQRPESITPQQFLMLSEYLF